MLDERTFAADPSELPWQLDTGLVFVDERPIVFALYRRGDRDTAGQVVAWLLVLPDGNAILQPTEGTPARPILTTLHSVRRRWIRLLDAELVQVVGRQAQHML
ncbi:hypothetical protein [Phytohabitans aurantiacus]|uniref:Uncharacterized protein n=1 Tax=Phytohabitans aurantiacus TaxID=3016789 RepID=A0ABQ5QMV2_9ACTN|nr:hypothetical protein [Phytohabitans aurantiacus]GLH95878.1 hypothetical protein Pa4123_11500 [Phytohabitans aurantiacus]